MIINKGILNGPYKLDRDCFGYHITTEPNFYRILKTGLKPKMGERSHSIGEEIKGVFFFEDLRMLPFWTKRLYEDKDLLSLKVLRIHLEGLLWYAHNGGEDYFLKRTVPISRLDYLKTMSINGEELPINYCPGGDEEVVYDWIGCEKFSIK